MTVRVPLTLLAGGAELGRLVSQLVDPPGACVVVELTGTSSGTGGGHAQDTLVDDIVDVLEGSPATRRMLVVLNDHDVIGAAISVLADQRLTGLTYLDGLVVTVDAVHLATRLAAGQPVDSDIGLDRLAIADRIVVARSVDVTPQALGAIGHVLRSLNRTGPIIAPSISTCSLDDLLDLDGWSGPPSVGPGPDRRSPFLDADAPVTVVCRTDRPLEVGTLNRWLEEILTDHGADLLRLQGSLRLVAQPGRTYLHGARRCLVRSSGMPVQRSGAEGPSVVALVGRHLPAGSIQAGFALIPS